MNPEFRIYGAYLESGKGVLYFNEMKRLTDLSDSSLTNSLKKLVGEGLLSREKTKSNTFYRIKDKTRAALRFSEIAAAKFSGLNKGVRVPLKIFLKKVPKETYAVILFGSASKKEEKKGSDIDLLAVSGKRADLAAGRKEAEITSKYRISLFHATISQFIRAEDDVVIQARKTGFPIYGEQNFYEAMLDGTQ